MWKIIIQFMSGFGFCISGLGFSFLVCYLVFRIFALCICLLFLFVISWFIVGFYVSLPSSLSCFPQSSGHLLLSLSPVLIVSAVLYLLCI